VPVNPVPVSVTAPPTGAPPDGENEVTAGVTMTVKLALVPVPAAFVTEIAPVTAPLGTVVVICVSLTTVNVAVTLFVNFTALVPVNPVPVRVTAPPTGAPPDGEN